MKLYYNIYYRFYRLSIALGETVIARYNAVLIFSLVQVFNLFEIITLISVLNDRIYIVDWPKLPLLFIGLGIILINTIIIFKKGKHEKINIRFKNETKENRIRGVILTVFYVILTFSLFAACLIYLNNNPIRPN